tara:strand:+ start:192 stop:488 length:297 start_codon:yes stop_codon:yes gene_type:complete
MMKKTYVRTSLRQDQADRLLEVLIDAQRNTKKWIVDAAQREVNAEDMAAHLEHLEQLRHIFDRVEDKYLKAQQKDDVRPKTRLDRVLERCMNYDSTEQ